MHKYLHEREEINQLYDAPKNRGLKYVALAVIAVAILLLLYMTFWIDNIPPITMSIMRGCAGLCAIVFAVLYGILSYRVNKEHIKNRRK